MYHRIIEIPNELECHKVKQLLEENEIPLFSNQSANSAFPVLESSNNIHQIIIPEEYSAQYFRLTKQEYTTRLIKIQTDGKRSKTKLWLYIMIAYGFIMSVLFVKYFDMHRKGKSEKNYTSEWNHTNTKLRLINKKTKMVDAIYEDRNFDLNYEKILNYSHGKLISESYDKDENGTYEEIHFFDMKGNRSGQSIDADQNGMYEISIAILENGNKIIMEDKDQNGIYEIRE